MSHASHHDPHAQAHGSHAHPAPSLPQIVDEAGETPNWVPALGVGLLAIACLLGAARLAMNDGKPDAAPVDDAVAAAPEGEAAPADAPAAAEPEAAQPEAATP
jgi:hypothetical protein